MLSIACHKANNFTIFGVWPNVSKLFEIFMRGINRMININAIQRMNKFVALPANQIYNNSNTISSPSHPILSLSLSRYNNFRHRQFRPNANKSSLKSETSKKITNSIAHTSIYTAWFHPRVSTSSFFFIFVASKIAK